MQQLPLRGAGVRELELALPPARMPRLHRRRPLKRWTYVGVFGPELMACAGEAFVGPLPIRWWALAEPGRPLVERSWAGRRRGLRLGPDRLAAEDGDVRLELAIEPAGEPVEVASPAGRSYAWTRKTPARARGTVATGGGERELDCPALVDESAGYHERRTAWRWSAGAGSGAGGERIAWNLVSGIHDAPEASERTVWIDGEPRELPPVEFDPDLGGVRFPSGDGLRFAEWAARSDETNLLVFRSRYRQPFGEFHGVLPGGHALAAGHGVMEEHEALW